MIYRKRGSVVRWENGTLVRVTESGMAVETEELFECRPDVSGDVPRVVDSKVIEAASAVQDVAAAAGVTIERLIVIEGVAEHVWSAAAATAAFVSDSAAHEHTKAVAATTALQNHIEHTRRMHISLVRAHTRAILDLGSFELADVVRVAGVLARVEAMDREAPARLRLAPNVTAALLPSLIGIAPPNVRLLQTAGGVDGCGEPIVEASEAWPNWYRPSYRIRPVRAPLQLRIECDVKTIDAGSALAVALLAPVSVMNGELVLRVLIDGRDGAFASTLRVARIDAVSDERTWYPYGGGSFGAEMVL
ncbi:MAG: hypothetical protein M3P06_19290 [Acidobacteriota bacterium]|nr:hypothetical protein [Acidobacteriota bacterium]